ncbi:hypothetical protein ACFWA6_15645 [Streptomyces sp. NPDC060020]|uniref:hypothetical protein n=1 Tax=Streptomyces sp. NPDC060020 TaxID=3347038 RepID=UPI0036CC7428
MSETTRAEDRLQLAQWHLSRADQLRLGLVNRAGALLSANALVIAGTAFISGSTLSRISPIIGVTALLALAVSAYSIAQVTGVLTGPRRVPALSRPQSSPIPIAFSYSDTVNEFSSPRAFQDQLLAQSIEEATNDATLELWRCISIHHLRTIKLQRATRGLLASAIVLVVMTAEKLLLGLL